MPISIPTSVAGISVPGLANGPLNLLYGNKYNNYTYSFPRDLANNPTRNHVILFTVMKPAPDNQQGITETDGKKAWEATKKIGKSASGAFSGIGLSSTPTSVADSAAAFGKDVKKEDIAAVAEPLKKVFVTDIKRVAGDRIALYVPDTVNVSYSAGYDELSLSGALGNAYFLAQAGASLYDKFSAEKELNASKIGNIVGNDPFVRTKIAEAIGNKVGVTGAADLAAKSLGVAMNPQLQVLFRGMGFRQFQFDFVLTPTSKAEAKQIEEIIKAFKYAAAPNIKANSFFEQGMFMEVPYPFKIEFFYKGEENKHVHRLGQCVLENVTVDYAPNGWSTFNDGTPVQTKLTLQFKETIIVDKNRITEGY